MKKGKIGLLCALMALAMMFCGCGSSSLKEITNPHLGMYECTQAKLNEKDYLTLFSYIHLELKEDGVFILHYRMRDGMPQEESGNYVYNREKGSFSIVGKESFQREFFLEEGRLTILVPLGTQTLTLTFEQK